MAKPTQKYPKSRNQTRLSSLRIIGGALKRRLVYFEEATGLRPTPDRLRETLFNWLQFDLAEAQVLDLCAGSGALGFESLSRGAERCTFVEPNLQTMSQIRSNAQTLEVTHRCHFAAITAQQLILETAEVFDVVFVDPPYGLKLWQELLEALTQSPCIHSNSLIYVESDEPHGWANQALQLLNEKKIGSIYAAIYKLC